MVFIHKKFASAYQRAS